MSIESLAIIYQAFVSKVGFLGRAAHTALNRCAT